MTQEEIEALMNDTIMDTPNNDEQSIDDLLAGIDGIVDDGDSKDSSGYDNSIDDLLAGIDGIVDNNDNTPKEKMDETDLDALLAGIGGITEDEVKVEPKKEPKQVAKQNKEEEDSIGSKINKGIYPMPVEKEHKVVNQLNEVAEDSEEKASQIFDVLSFILDENDIIQTESGKVSSFIDSQIKLLETLVAK
ncbi:MAG: hypothetical protein HY307_02205, partial [Arcobacter sp.]|nr:hypothetical protein [Arcobacter sp.]